MNDEEFDLRMQGQTLIRADFFPAAFAHWFSNGDEFRTPFPEYMHDDLRRKAERAFMEWTFGLSDSERAEVTAKSLSQKFGEVITELGLSLARTEDDRLTIHYPALPRKGDMVNLNSGPEKIEGGVVYDRREAHREGKRFLKIVLRSPEGETRVTEFELP